ncbi:MAG: hypothetical protein JWM64_1218 [Frankiales bacterium]|nr:hypothetical protein [Frankiales bacterium]
MTVEQAAAEYAQALAVAAASPVAAEPEAQLTVPVQNFLQAVAAADGVELRLLREAQLDGLRPDFAALDEGALCGWVELKAPGHSLDGSTWSGREQRQWERLAELDNLLVSDGHAVQRYVLGEPIGDPVDLPSVVGADWDAVALTAVLRVFAQARPPAITRVSQLASRLAPMARLLRDRFATLASEQNAAALAAAAIWRARIHADADDGEVASDLAQVVAYSLAIAVLRFEGLDSDDDGRVTLRDARGALEPSASVLSAALGPVLDTTGLADLLQVEIGALERLVSAVDRTAVLASRDPRGEPWLWFYEDFLAAYEPEARRESGVFYTPLPVVRAQVRLTEHILTDKFDLPLGYGHRSVTTLDPATGSGTYPLAVLDAAAATAERERGMAGPRQVARTMSNNLIAFELMPGPYAVAHLRIGQKLADMEGTLAPEQVRVYLTDTLDDADTGQVDSTLFGPVRVLAEERRRANLVKADEAVQVILGNPPYRRTSGQGNGWMHTPLTDGGSTPFQDVIVPAQQAGVIFSAQASLYDLYVYFWRWGLWKAFQQNPKQSAAVSFITGSTWLRGPAFVGLRALARDLADEIWVLNLGGEGRGAVTEDNVFAIQSAVAVVTLYRKGAGTRGPAKVLYRRVSGTRADKLAAVDQVQVPVEGDTEWSRVPGTGGDPLALAAGGAGWSAMPALTDLFPWQQPGIMFNRTWPVAPDPDTLQARWAELLSNPAPTARAAKFVTGSSGRNINTQVAGLPTLSSLAAGSASLPVVRHAYRTFDREWTFEDPRLAKTESPSLWRSLSGKQVFLNSMTTSPLGEGPALTACIDVPDKHHFRGSYGGKDVLPLYRDAAASQPNVPAGLLEQLGGAYGRTVTVEDLAAYAYALLSTPGYRQRLSAELADPGPRVPLTDDPELFDQAVQQGLQLLWLHTWTERYRDTTAGRGNRLPAVEGLGWAEPVTALPAAPADITYDSASHVLHVGTGQVIGVRPDVWGYSISGYQPLPAWLGRRTRRGTGRAATRPGPLDRIRPPVWHDDWNDELLDLIRVLTHTRESESTQNALLDAVLAGGLIPAGTLPVPTAASRRPPATFDSNDTLDFDAVDEGND